MEDDLGPVPEGEGSVEHLPVHEAEGQEQSAQPLPEVTRPFGLGLRGLEQGAAALLALVDEKRQHHQVGEHRAEVLVAVAEVVLEGLVILLYKLPSGRVVGEGELGRRRSGCVG